MLDASADTPPSSVRKQYGGMAAIPVLDLTMHSQLVPIGECDVADDGETATYIHDGGCPACGSDLVVRLRQLDDYGEHPAMPEWPRFGQHCTDETCPHDVTNSHLAPGS